MRLLRVEGENFARWEQFGLDLADRGLVLVVGPNGSGKTSLVVDPATWALYEQTYPRPKAPGGWRANEVVREGTDECEVRLLIEDDRGDSWWIVRGRKRGPYLRVFKLDGPAVADPEAAIRGLLGGLDWRAWCHGIIFGQGLMTRLAAASDAEVKGVVEDALLNLSVLGEARLRASARQTAAERRRNEASFDAEGAEGRIAEAKADLAALQAEELGWRDVQGLRLVEARKAVEEAGQWVLMAQTAIKVTRLVEAKALSAQEAAQAKQEEISAARDVARDAANALSAAGAEHEDLRQRAEGAKRLRGACPACLRAVTADSRREIEAAWKAAVAAAAEEVKRARKVEIDVSGRWAALGESGLDAALVAARKAVSARAVAEADAKAAADSVTEARERHDAVRAERWSGVARRAELTKRLKDAEDVLRAAREGKANAERDGALAGFWVEGFGNAGLRSLLLDEVSPFLNARISHYLGILSGGATQAEFTATRATKRGALKEEAGFRVTHREGASRYSGSSGGERQVVDLPVALAVQDLAATRAAGRIAYGVFDEPFDGLDALHRERALGMLVAERRKGTTFVVTHNPELAVSAVFDAVIQVEKVDGVSRIVDG